MVLYVVVVVTMVVTVVVTVVVAVVGMSISLRAHECCYDLGAPCSSQLLAALQ
jgi:hypothetical protein